MELVLCRKRINLEKLHFASLKDVLHTLDIEYYLIIVCIEYTNTLNSQQVTAVDCSDQPIYIPCKIIQWKYLEFAFPKYFALFGALHIETELLMAKRTPSRTRRNSRWYIHWYNDTSIVLIYTCLKEAHKVSNSVLLFSWAEERFSSSSMFKYWMLIMKFQISYLVFIRSMREHNFKPFVKILIFMVKWFSISISIITIMLDGYPCIFKICWIFLSHALNSRIWKRKFCDPDFR